MIEFVLALIWWACDLVAFWQWHMGMRVRLGVHIYDTGSLILNNFLFQYAVSSEKWWRETWDLKCIIHLWGDEWNLIGNMHLLLVSEAGLGDNKNLCDFRFYESEVLLNTLCQECVCLGGRVDVFSFSSIIHHEF